MDSDVNLLPSPKRARVARTVNDREYEGRLDGNPGADGDAAEDFDLQPKCVAC